MWEYSWENVKWWLVDDCMRYFNNRCLVVYLFACWTIYVRCMMICFHMMMYKMIYEIYIYIYIHVSWHMIYAKLSLNFRPRGKHAKLMLCNHLKSKVMCDVHEALGGKPVWISQYFNCLLHQPLPSMSLHGKNTLYLFMYTSKNL